MNIRKIIKSNRNLNKVVEIPFRFCQKIKFLSLELYVRTIGLSNGKKRMRLLSKKNSNELIKQMLASDKPFMIARYGGTEFSNLTVGGEEYFKKLCILSGFFPEDIKFISKFKKVYREAEEELDVLAIWIYKHYFRSKLNILRHLRNLKNLVSIDSLNPLDNNWVESLSGKRVLVVHPFEKSILFQYKRRKKIKIIPLFKRLIVIKAVQTIAGEEDKRFKDWFEALEHMKREIYKRRREFDIVIIGCGAYGFPLAAYSKKLGKQAIHMAGVTQLLFGIKGKRWENEGIKFPTDWIYPLPEDTPKKKDKVEGGCYW